MKKRVAAMPVIAVLLLSLLPFAVFAQEPPAPAPETPAPAPAAQATAPAPADGAADEFTTAVYYGKKFFELNDYASAFEQFAKADALRPDQAAVLYDMALTLAKAGRYAEAQVKADRYTQLFPQGAEKSLIQRLQLDLGFQRVLKDKRKADEDYVDLFGRASFLYSKNELADALAIFRQAETLRPTDPAAVYNQAIVLQKQGELTKAVERYRHYAELERDPEQRATVDQRVFAIEKELEEMRTMIVCPFCGHKLPQTAHWCHRCWHGPYDVKSAVWNSRACGEGASATRTTYYSDNRFEKNDVLPCLFQNGTMLETLRYTPQRQRAIQDARKAEGWTYNGEVIQGFADKVRYQQGGEYLEKVTASSGEILTFVAHKAGEGFYLLDREDLVIDAQKYTARYTFDANNRIAHEQVEYQNAAACNHLIGMTADYVYQNDALMQVNLQGGYEGFAAEGSPKTEWAATVAYAYDEQSRVQKEELTVTKFQKTYAQRPQGELREEVKTLYMTMRPKQPVDLLRVGDLCATSGNVMIGNLIDLRPFYAMSPNLAVALPRGVVRAVVSFTYPPR
jgi:tetratricopeptide (TPR) repeat protein